MQDDLKKLDLEKETKTSQPIHSQAVIKKPEPVVAKP